MKFIVLVLLALVVGCQQESKPEPSKTPPSAPKVDKDGMCVEHGVPKDLCTRCNPALGQVFKAKGDWCEEHQFPESFCPICNPDAKAPDISDSKEDKMSDGQIEGRVVRLRNSEIEKSAGIKTVEAVEATGSATLACSAELRFNANKLADIRAIVPGVVRKISAELGQSVKKGDPLFVLESTRIGDIQAQLQTANERIRVAESNLKRQRQLASEQIASQRQVEMAESELASAKAAAQSAHSTLRMAGAGNSTASGRYGIRSPIDGEVVRRPAVVGVLATEQESLATIADTKTLWAMCAIPERQAVRVQPGHKLQLKPDGADEPIVGDITWVSPEVDPRTRMVSARAEIPNTSGILRANQYLDASIIAGSPAASVMVPRDAVQRVEGRNVVFVRASAGTYIPRVVSVWGDTDPVAVKGNVKPGDAIVTQGAVFLRTEVLPNSIGAGCCEPVGAE